MSTYTNAANTSTADFSYAKLMETMTKFKDEMAKNPLAKINYIVASKQGLDIVTKTIGPSNIEQPNWLDARLFGIPVLCYAKEREARTKALELSVIENKKVIFIDDAGNCLDLSHMEFKLPENVYFGAMAYPYDDSSRTSNNR